MARVDELWTRADGKKLDDGRGRRLQVCHWSGAMEWSGGGLDPETTTEGRERTWRPPLQKTDAQDARSARLAHRKEKERGGLTIFLPPLDGRSAVGED